MRVLVWMGDLERLSLIKEMGDLLVARGGGVADLPAAANTTAANESRPCAAAAPTSLTFTSDKLIHSNVLSTSYWISTADSCLFVTFPSYVPWSNRMETF